VRPRCKTSTHYFSCTGGTGTESTNIALGHVTLNFCFLHPVGYAGHVVHFGASGERIIDTIFFKLSWGRYGFDKKRFKTRYAELLYLHPVRSVGQEVHFGASEERIIDTLFFKLGCDRYGFDKKRFRTRNAELHFLHPVGSAGHIVHSGASEA
jgi:hypothetical protein